MKYLLSVLLIALIFVPNECGLTKDDPLITDETQAVQYLKQTNEELAKQLNIYTTAQWNYNTNINGDTSAAQVYLFLL